MPDSETNTMTAAADWTVPTRRAATWHRLRVWAHALLRALRNALGPRIERHLPSDRLADAPLLAEYRSPLWNDGREDELMLVAGKATRSPAAARRGLATARQRHRLETFVSMNGTATPRCRHFVARSV